MMSDPTSVDRTTFDELTGKLVLLIEESRPWQDSAAMQRQLSAKVRHYVRHIRSESFAREHSQRPQDTIVRLLSSEPLAKDSFEFFERISYELSKNGIDFEYQVGDEGVPVLVTPGATVAPPPSIPGEGASPPQRAPERTVETPSEAPEETEGVPPTRTEPAQSGLAAELAEQIDEALEALEVGSLEFADTDETERLEAAEAEESASEPPTPEPQEAAASFFSPDQLGEEPSGREPWEVDYFDEAPSELEMLIEAPDDIASRYIGLDDTPVPAPEPAAAAEAAESEEPAGELELERTHPPFFPEEEFGRSALPEPDDVRTLLRGVEVTPFEPAIIETSSGKRIVIEARDAARRGRRARADEAGPSLRRAVGAALGAAIAGAVIWAVLAIPAGQGASPLALAVALMVGMSVRLRGGGHTDAFRLVACLGTVFGSALGALLATAALVGWSQGEGLAGVVNLFAAPANLWAAIDATFDTIDLVSLVIALYIAYKISASKPSD